jgi:hypothetical protein
LRIQRFDICAAANDSAQQYQDSWSLLVDRTGIAVHVEHSWRDAKPAPREGMRMVTLAEFLRNEQSESLRSRVVDTLKTAGIAANDP